MREDVTSWSVAIAACIMNGLQAGTFFFTPTTIMPTIVKDLSIPLSLATLPIAVGKVAYVLQLVPGGILVDQVGPRLAVLFGISTLALLMALYASFASSFSSLLIFHLLLASSASVSGVPVYSIFIANWFTPSNIGLPMGFVLSGYSAAGSLFPAVLGPLTESFGWRGAITAIVLVLTFIALPVSYCFLRQKSTEEGTDHLLSIPSATPILSSVPVSEFAPLADTRSWPFVGFALSYALLQYCNGCFFENIMFFLTIDRKFSTTSASFVLSSLNISAFFAKLIGGYIGDRFDRFYVGSIASAIAAVGTIFLFVDVPSVYQQVIPALTTSSFAFSLFTVLYGFGYGATFNCLYALVPIVFGKKNLGRTQSTLFGIGLLGNASGAVLTSMLRAKFGTYQIPFLSAVLSCIANFFVLTITRRSLGDRISRDAISLNSDASDRYDRHSSVEEDAANVDGEPINYNVSATGEANRSGGGVAKV